MMRFVAAVAVAVAVGVGLTGCTGTTAGTGTATDAASQVPSAAAAPAASAPPSPATPSCATALTPEAYTDFARRGLRPQYSTEWGPDRFRHVEAFVIPQPGIMCAWQSAGGDQQLYFAQIALTGAEWESVQAELVRTGFVEQDTPVAGYFNGPVPDPLYGDGGFAYRDGYLYYAVTPEFTRWIPAFARASG
jgi:hypothetical protein